MSSGSESDDEYVPGEPEQLSEEDSADDETEKQYENELDHKAKKRKAAGVKKSIKKRKTRTSNVDNEQKTSKEEEETAETVTLNSEDEKKREDNLWALFLDGTDTKRKAHNEVTTKPAEVTKIETKPIAKEDKVKTESVEEKERKIFEFAGETIVVENNVIKEKIKTADVTAASSKPIIAARSRGAGISNLLGELNKKNKLSTLEKSKLDWDTYKQEEGIEEEIKTHNKGKAGYLDRQDFLERADVRQYEIERDLRLNRRSNR